MTHSSWTRLRFSGALMLATACAPSGHREEMHLNALPRYLALGDSYTIGEGVAARERWPAQLAALLGAQGVPLAEPEIIARTGWTTDELEAGIADAAPQPPYALVSLLIGVNNQYRGRPLDEYRTHFRGLLRQAIGYAGGRAEGVMVLSIPDWGVTPFAEGRDRQQIAREIDAFNQAAREEVQRAGAAWVDVTPASRAGASQVVDDGLHPSAEQYRVWAVLALPAALAALRPMAPPG